MRTPLDAVLDDLHVGLRRRAARRRARARAVATGSASLVLAAIALSMGAGADPQTPTFAASGASRTEAAMLLQGCTDRTQLACFDPLQRH